MSRPPKLAQFISPGGENEIAVALGKACADNQAGEHVDIFGLYIAQGRAGYPSVRAFIEYF